MSLDNPVKELIHKMSAEMTRSTFAACVLRATLKRLEVVGVSATLRDAALAETAWLDEKEGES